MNSIYSSVSVVVAVVGWSGVEMGLVRSWWGEVQESEGEGLLLLAESTIYVHMYVRTFLILYELVL